MFKKLAKRLYILQDVSNKNRQPVLGRGFSTAMRMNPYNPLSYIVIVIAFVIMIVAYGVVGIKDQVDFTNPFKWN